MQCMIQLAGFVHPIWFIITPKPIPPCGPRGIVIQFTRFYRDESLQFIHSSPIWPKEALFMWKRGPRFPMPRTMFPKVTPHKESLLCQMLRQESLHLRECRALKFPRPNNLASQIITPFVSQSLPRDTRCYALPCFQILLRIGGPGILKSVRVLSISQNWKGLCNPAV